VGFKRTGELPHHDHGHVEGLDEGEALLAPGEAIPMRDELTRDMPAARGRGHGPARARNDKGADKP
jgi:hypothetical protein